MSHLLPDGSWASVPLGAAVISLITSICSSRRAASSSPSAVWVLSVSSAEVGSDGKQRPSAQGCDISPVPHPCWVAGPKIKNSHSVKSQDWVGCIFWGGCAGVHIFSACRGCPLCTSPCLHTPLGCLTARWQVREDEDAAQCCCACSDLEPPWELSVEQTAS